MRLAHVFYWRTANSNYLLEIEDLLKAVFERARAKLISCSEKVEKLFRPCRAATILYVLLTRASA